MGIKGQLFGIWSIIIAGPFLILTFWLMAGFIPLPSPSMGATEVAALYQRNSSGIRLTASAWAIQWSFWLPFSAAIAAQMARAEKGFPYW